MKNNNGVKANRILFVISIILFLGTIISGGAIYKVIVDRDKSVGDYTITYNKDRERVEIVGDNLEMYLGESEGMIDVYGEVTNNHVYLNEYGDFNNIVPEREFFISVMSPKVFKNREAQLKGGAN